MLNFQRLRVLQRGLAYWLGICRLRIANSIKRRLQIGPDILKVLNPHRQTQ